MTTRRILLDPAAVAAVLGEARAVLPPELLEPPAATEPLHPAVRQALDLLVTPGLPRVEVRAASAFRRRLTVLAVGGGVGTSLARDLAGPEPERPLEQSVFPDDALGEELRRCLPALPVTSEPRVAAVGTDPALLLAAHSGQDGAVLAAAGGWSGPGAESVEAVTRSSYAGSFVATVSSGPVVGRVVWVHADGGWWQLRPDADRHGERTLDLLPVGLDDLLPALSPLLAQGLALSVAKAAR